MCLNSYVSPFLVFYRSDVRWETHLFLIGRMFSLLLKISLTPNLCFSFLRSLFIRSLLGFFPLSIRPVQLVFVYTVFLIITLYLGICIILEFFAGKAVPLCVLIVCGSPFSVMYCSKSLLAVFPFDVSHVQAAGHLLYRVLEINMLKRRCSNFIGPAKPNWTFWFSFSADG